MRLVCAFARFRYESLSIEVAFYLVLGKIVLGILCKEFDMLEENIYSYNTVLKCIFEVLFVKQIITVASNVIRL